MSLIQKAKRSKSFLKLGVAGPSGSGKTYSALLLAKGLLGGSLEKCVVLDTENGSANLYEDLGTYSVLPFAPPYHPDRYGKAIDLCVKEGFEVIIIDSTSHEWEGEGGCLDLQTKFGGRFQDWAKVTPLHNNFIQSILQAKAHIICTMRKKQSHEITESNGKKQVVKVGLKEIQRDGFEYELSVSFDINIDHIATSSKDRTGLFPNTAPFMISEETGKTLKTWNEGEKK
jgi:hypothetical protein